MCTHASTLTMCTSKKMVHGSTDDRQAPERKLWGSRLAGCAVPCLNPIEYINKQSEQTNRANPNTKPPTVFGRACGGVATLGNKHARWHRVHRVHKLNMRTSVRRTPVPEHLYPNICSNIIIILCRKVVSPDRSRGML